MRPGAPQSASPHTLQLIDDEIRRISEDALGRAIHTLNDHRTQLDALAAALLRKETLDESEAHAVAGIPQPSPPSADGPATPVRLAADPDRPPEGDVTPAAGHASQAARGAP